MAQVYLICNIHRSGSSMLMRCLEGADMPVAYTHDHEGYNQFGVDYVPNPNGFYAPPNIGDLATFAERFNGKAFKFNYRLLPELPDDGNIYNILFLKRNPDEIQASMNAFSPFMQWNDAHILPFYEEISTVFIEQISQKPNVNVIVLNYSEIVSDAYNQFTKLLNAGWNFNLQKAVNLIDDSLYRFRLENE